MLGRKGRWAVWLWLGLVLPRVGLAQTAIDAGNERYEQASLANGLRVYLAEDHRVPLVGISISYPVGETLDPPDARGAAELVAKLLPVVGTKHFPNGPEELIAAAGFYPWKVEATVRVDETRLDLVVPAAAVDLALYLEAERMGFVAEAVTTTAVEWGKKQVKEEFDATSGGERVATLSQQLVFGPSHPYGVSGSAPALSKVDVDWVRRRLRRFYGVRGVKLSIVGDVDSKRLLPVVKQLFGRLQGLPAPVPALPSAGASAPSKPAEVRANDVHSGLAWAWRTPRFLSDDDITLDVAARYLSHRLSQRLAAGDVRAGVGARQVSMPKGSMFWLFAPVPSPQARASVELSMREELDAVAAGKVDAAELATAKSRIIGDIASDMDDLTSRARFLISYASLYDKLDGFQQHLTTYANVDAARLASVVGRYLGASNAVAVTLVRDEAAKVALQSRTSQSSFKAPAAPGELLTPDALEWYRPPTAIPVPRFDPPRIFEANVGKSRLLFMPRLGLPTLKLRVALNWQVATTVPAARSVLSESLLHARPAGRPTLEDRLADLGATLVVSSDLDSLSLVVTTLVEHADEAMAAIRDTLDVEHFEPVVFSAAHESVLKSVAADKADEWSLAGRWLARLAYPARHRYQSNDVADVARVLLLKRYDQRQLEAFWKAERRAENLTVSIVGPVDEARAKALAQAGLPRFSEGKVGKPSTLSLAPGLLLVDAPSNSDDVRVQFSWPVTGFGTAGYAESLGLRWLLGERVAGGLSDYLRKNGVKSLDDWFSNTLGERDQMRLVFAVKVPKAELQAVLKAVPLYVASLQRGEIRWETAQDARREAVQWVAQNFDGAKQCLNLLSSLTDFGVAASSGSDLYLLAQRIDKSSLAKAAAMLAPERANVLAYGAVAGLEKLETHGFGPVRTFSAQNPGKPQ